jgi:hypothetical protein
VGTLSAELAAHAPLPEAPRVYADANVPAGVVHFMRHVLGWDVLFVVEHDDLRRAHDRRHFELAPNEVLLSRTLAELDLRLFGAGHAALPLIGRKLVADPTWMDADS